jgi:hypothetical protein
MVVVGARGWAGYTKDLTFPVDTWDVGAEGRAGFAVGDSALLYGSAGTEYFFNGGAVFGTLGLGAEFKVSDTVGLDLEYKHWWPMSGPTSQANSVTGSLLWHFH